MTSTYGEIKDDAVSKTKGGARKPADDSAYPSRSIFPSSVRLGVGSGNRHQIDMERFGSPRCCSSLAGMMSVHISHLDQVMENSKRISKMNLLLQMFSRLVFSLSLIIASANAFSASGSEDQNRRGVDSVQDQSINETSSNAAVSALWEWVDLIEELRAHIDRSQLSLSAVIESNDYDADALTRYVAENIAYEQYPGLMRGVDGTLLTRAGNALDQAILLAALLKDSGYDVRIASAKIGEPAAKMLLAQMGRRPPPPMPFRQSAGEVLLQMAQFVEQHQQQGGQETDLLATEIGEWQSQAVALESALAATLKDNGVSLSAEDNPEQLIEEAREYAWVQYKVGPSDPWVDVHPAFAREPDAFLNLQPRNYYVDEIPVELQQRLKLQLFGVRRVGNREEVIEIMAPWERPVANLFQVPVILSIQPTPSPYEVEGDQPRLFLPMLGENIAPGGQVFSLDGNVVPPDAAMSFMSGLFQTIGSQTNKAASALGQMGSSATEEPRKAMAFEDLWLEVELILPGSDEKRSWRRSFRSINDEMGLTVESVSRRIVLNVNFGPLVEAQSQDRLLEYHAEALKLSIRQHIEAQEASLLSGANQTSAQIEVNMSIFDSSTVFEGFLKHHTDVAEGVLSYRPEPLVLANHQSLAPASGEPIGLDIISNARRSVEVTANGQIRLRPDATLSVGLWEAISEAAVLELEEEISISAVSESAFMLSEGEQPLFLDSAATRDDALAQSGLYDEILEAIADERVVVVPPVQDLGANAGPKAWWEIDPETGQIIGVTENGWGGAFFILAAPATEKNIMENFAKRIGCVMAADMGCRATSKAAVATLVNALHGVTGWKAVATCKLLMMAFVNTPEDICEAFMAGAGSAVGTQLKKIEDVIYKACRKPKIRKCASL